MNLITPLTLCFCGFVASHEFFAWENKISSAQYYRMEKGSNMTIKSRLRILDIHGMTLLEFFAGVKEGPGKRGSEAITCLYYVKSKRMLTML